MDDNTLTAYRGDELAFFMNSSLLTRKLYGTEQIIQINQISN